MTSFIRAHLKRDAIQKSNLRYSVFVVIKFLFLIVPHSVPSNTHNPASAVQVAALLSYLQLHATQVGIVPALPTALLALHACHCLHPNTRQSKK